MDRDELATQNWEDEGGALGAISPENDFGQIDEITEAPIPALESALQLRPEQKLGTVDEFVALNASQALTLQQSLYANA